MSTPLLTYNVTSNPDPIQASPTTGNSSLATLVIVASNSTSRIIDCKSIVFSFPVGQNAKDFSGDTTGIQTTPPSGWSIEQSSGVFTAAPDTPVAGHVGPAGLTFVFSQIKVNQQPGTFDLTVTETTATQTGVLVIPLGKFPPQFIVKPLKASPLSVGPGGSTTLTWCGSSGATYVLQYNDVVITKTTDGQPLPAIGSYAVKDLQEDTTFSLVVTLQGPGEGQPMVQRQCTVTVVRAQIFQFNAFPLTLGMDATCKLSWETNADQCYLDPGNQNVSAPDGSTSMPIHASTNLTLTATKGTDITQQSRSVTVVPPVIKAFTATPAGPVNAGDSVTLQWDTQYATTAAITPGIGPVSASDSVVVKPQNTTTYTLTCTGQGNPVTKQVTVAVNSVEITSFTVSPTVTNPGDPATLSWATQRPTSATLNGTTVAIPSGTQQVNPQRDTTYTLTCQGPNGPVSKSVTLATNCVKITSFNLVCVDTETNCAWGGWPGTKYSINWSTNGLATSTELSFNGKVVATESGTYIYVQSYDWEVYTLTVKGPGGPDISSMSLHYHD
jgi:hypothetical protein